MFAGVSRTVLIAAGGTTFPALAPRPDRTKIPTPHDTIWVYRFDAQTWTQAARRLDRPLAHGLSVAGREGVICIGGDDGQRCFGPCFRTGLGR